MVGMVLTNGVTSSQGSTHEAQKPKKKKAAAPLLPPLAQRGDAANPYAKRSDDELRRARESELKAKKKVGAPLSQLHYNCQSVHDEAKLYLDMQLSGVNLPR